ncbi:MAG: hypothetical protein M1282_04655 [Chloroflexi bacterium]|nr:hypothetical protein [Chloroflexota bacterium]
MGKLTTFYCGDTHFVLYSFFNLWWHTNGGGVKHVGVFQDSDFQNWMKDLATAQNNTDPSQSDALWAKVNVQIYANNLGRKVTIRPMDMNETTTGDGSIPVKDLNIVSIYYKNFKATSIVSYGNYLALGTDISNNSLYFLVDPVINLVDNAVIDNQFTFTNTASYMSAFFELNSGSPSFTLPNPFSFMRIIESNSGSYNESSVFIAIQ